MAECAVRVTLVDAADGRTFAESEVPAGALPEVFTAQTRMHLGEQEWVVVSAQPDTRAAIVAHGSVVLTLSRVVTVDPKLVHYSLPTVCEHLPPLVARSEGATALQFRLDDWRQIEFVAAAFADEVASELAAVRAVYAEQAGRAGFSRLHMRKGLSSPLLDLRLSIAGLQKRFGGEWGGSVWTEDLGGQPAQVDGGAWFRLQGGLVGYAVAADGRVETLGLMVQRGPMACMHGIPHAIDLGADRAMLAGLARDHDLLLVDWCAAQLVAWD